MTDSEATYEGLEKGHLALLLQASEILGSSMDVQSIVDSLMDQVIDSIHAERGFILMRDGETGAWRMQSARAISPDALEREDFRISRGVVERVGREGVSILTSDALQDPRLRDQRSVSLYDLKSILCVPLRIRGEVQGVVYADHTMQRAVFTRQEKIVLESIARLAAMALENAMLYQELQRVHAQSMEQARRELAAAQSQLVHSSKMAAVGQLAAGVAHEINTPLSAVRLNVSTVHENVTEPRDRRRLDIALQAVSRCKAIIDALLRFSRAPSGPLDAVDVGRMLGNTVALVDHDLRASAVEVRLDVDEGLVARGREGELVQVFLNLITNAREALRTMPEGHPRRLDIHATRDEGGVVVEVSDNGPGMEAAVCERIFEPFYTTRPVGDGLGLGLSISYEILARCQGTIHVASAPGAGTRFQVRLRQP